MKILCDQKLMNEYHHRRVVVTDSAISPVPGPQPGRQDAEGQWAPCPVWTAPITESRSLLFYDLVSTVFAMTVSLSDMAVQE